jgi:capsular polysaccharide biosynthesis protein
VFYVAPSSGYAGPNAYQGILLAQQEAASFAPVVDRRAVMGPVITDLRLATAPAQFAKQVSAISPTNGVLVDATAE